MDALQQLEKENEVLKGFVKESETKLTEMQDKLAAYEAIGTPADYQATIDNAISRIVEANKTAEVLEDELNSYRELATIEEVKQTLEALESYTAFASVEEMPKLESLLSAYVVLGTKEQLESKLEALSAYEAVGTVEALLSLKEEAVKLEAEKEQLRKESIVTDLASKYNISKELATETLELKQWDESATAEFLSKFKVVESAPAVEPEVTTVAPAVESAEPSLAGKTLTTESKAVKSLTSRILGSY